MNPERGGPSPEEIAEFEKKRLLNDAKLVQKGAEFNVEDGKTRLEPTKEQIEREYKAHNDAELAEARKRVESLKKRMQKAGKELEKKWEESVQGWNEARNYPSRSDKISAEMRELNESLRPLIEEVDAELGKLNDHFEQEWHGSKNEDLAKKFNDERLELLDIREAFKKILSRTLPHDDSLRSI